MKGSRHAPSFALKLPRRIPRSLKPKSNSAPPWTALNILSVLKVMLQTRTIGHLEKLNLKIFKAVHGGAEFDLGFKDRGIRRGSFGAKLGACRLRERHDNETKQKLFLFEEQLGQLLLSTAFFFESQSPWAS